MWSSLNQFEYLVESLDATILPPTHTGKRSMRTMTQLHDTMNAVRKYANEFVSSLKLFKSLILKDIHEDEATKTFFAAVEKSRKTPKQKQ